MPSRRKILQGAIAVLASNIPAAEAHETAIYDADFSDGSAAEAHAKLFDGHLRYVSHEVFGDPAGLLIEESVVNGVEDAGYSRELQLPIGWRLLEDLNAKVKYTAEFIKRGAGQGTLRINGTGKGVLELILGSDRHFRVSKGDDITGSLAIRLVPGSVAKSCDVDLIIIQRDAEGVPVSAQPASDRIQQLQSDKAWWAQVRTMALIDGHANLAVRISVPEVFSLTFEIDYPQIEAAPWRSSFCIGSRSKGVALLKSPISAEYFRSSKRGVVLTADAPRHSGEATLWSEHESEANYFDLIVKERRLYARVSSDGIVRETMLGTLPPLMRFSVALSNVDGTISISLNGKVAKTLLRNKSNDNVARLGSGSAGSWNSTIKRITIFCQRSISVATESRRDVVFFDDFDRPDSKSLGASPTGQRIQATGAISTALVSGKWVAENIHTGMNLAAYGKIVLEKPPRYMGAVLNWTTGSSGGAAGLIAATNNLSPPTDALHTIISDRDQIFQTITASSVDPALAISAYSVAMKRDDTTQYGVARLLNERESAVVFVGPDGEMPRHVSRTYAERIGNAAVFEHFWHAGQCKPEFTAVAAA